MSGATLRVMNPSEQGYDPLQGVPQTRHSALTPAGEIEQAAKIAMGLRRPRTGWQRTVFRAGVLFLLLFVVALALLTAYSYVSR
jgi:hypothetical protein